MPIKVTLEFATEADLLAYFGGKPAPVSAPKQKEELKSEAKLEPKDEAATKPASVTVAEKAAVLEKVVEPAKPKTDYPTLQKAVFKLAAVSREATTELLAGLKVKSFKELDASRWDEALAAVLAKNDELSEAAA